jgi:hypothetical protein
MEYDRESGMPFALFDCDVRVGEPRSTELEVWKEALEAGLISDLPVADEEGGQVLPLGFHVKQIDETSDRRLD